MGMFDTLKIHKSLLPDGIPDGLDWQTKCFDCSLTQVEVCEDGQVRIWRAEWETVPVEERPYPNEDGWKGSIGSCREINGRWENDDTTGIAEFYDDNNGNWISLFLHLKNGRVLRVSDSPVVK